MVDDLRSNNKISIASRSKTSVKKTPPIRARYFSDEEFNAAKEKYNKDFQGYEESNVEVNVRFHQIMAKLYDEYISKEIGKAKYAMFVGNKGGSNEQKTLSDYLKKILMFVILAT